MTTDAIDRAAAQFRKNTTAELERYRALMPSPDPDQGEYDREENIPAIERVLAERRDRTLVHVRLDWLIDVRGTTDLAVAIGAARDYLDDQQLGDFVAIDGIIPAGDDEVTVTLHAEEDIAHHPVFDGPTYNRAHIEALVRADVMAGYPVASRCPGCGGVSEPINPSGQCTSCDRLDARVDEHGTEAHA